MNELNQTAELMMSSHYADKFVAEYWQLKIRLKELEETLRKWDAGELDYTPVATRGLYDNQMLAMKEYLYTLEIRARIEGIDLGKE